MTRIRVNYCKCMTLVEKCYKLIEKVFLTS